MILCTFSSSLLHWGQRSYWVWRVTAVTTAVVTLQILCYSALSLAFALNAATLVTWKCKLETGMWNG